MATSSHMEGNHGSNSKKCSNSATHKTEKNTKCDTSTGHSTSGKQCCGSKESHKEKH